MKETEIIVLYFIGLLKDNSELVLPIKAKLPRLKEYLTKELSVRDLAMMVIKSSGTEELIKNNLKQVLIEKKIEFPEWQELLLKKYSTQEERIENLFKIPLSQAIDQYLEINGYPSEQEISSSLKEEYDHKFVQRKRQQKRKKRERKQQRKRRKLMNANSSDIVNIQ